MRYMAMQMANEIKLGNVLLGWHKYHPLLSTVFFILSKSLML